MSDHKTIKVNPEKSYLPMLPDERHINFFGMLSITSAASIATWLFVSGTFIGMYTNVLYGWIAGFFGVCVALVYHNYLTTIFTRWGIDQGVLGNATWGPKGNKGIVVGVGVVLGWSWSCIPAIMMGNAVNLLFGMIGVTGFIANPTLWALLTFFLGLFIGYKGTALMDRLFRIATPIMAVLIIMVTYVILNEYGFAATFAAWPAVLPVEDPITGFIIATEIAVGVGFSWPFFLGAFAKPALSEKHSFNSTFIGYGVVWALAMLPAIATSTLSGAGDPVDALFQIGGAWAGVWLLMLLVANMSSVVSNPYWISMAFVSMFPKLKWKYAILINMVVIIAIINQSIYTSFATFAAVAAAMYGPSGCVWVTDILLRKSTFNLYHAYNTTKRSVYYYWGGVNWLAMLATAIGFVSVLLIWNPLTFEVHIPALYGIVGASIPGSIIASLVYVVFYKLILQPKKIGVIDDPYAPLFDK